MTASPAVTFRGQGSTPPGGGPAAAEEVPASRLRKSTETVLPACTLMCWACVIVLPSRSTVALTS